jgi:hypothetical protein
MNAYVYIRLLHKKTKKEEFIYGRTLTQSLRARGTFKFNNIIDIWNRKFAKNVTKKQHSTFNKQEDNEEQFDCQRQWFSTFNNSPIKHPWSALSKFGSTPVC